MPIKALVRTCKRGGSGSLVASPLKALLSPHVCLLRLYCAHVCVEVVAVLYHLLRFDAYDAENEVVDVAEQLVNSRIEV